MRQAKFIGEKGFTLVEITIILLVLVILGAILLPVTERYIDVARLARAKEDIPVIGSIIVMALEDMGERFYLLDGNAPPPGAFVNGIPDHSAFNRIQLLVSDGDIPGLDLVTPADPSALSWLIPVNDMEVDLLARHLAGNDPGGLTSNRYRTPADTGTSSGWRGAYAGTPFNGDPWGNRYAINVEFLDPNNVACGGPCFNMDVIVLSAGPDERVTTAYQKDGIVVQLDDLIYPISGSAQ